MVACVANCMHQRSVKLMCTSFWPSSQSGFYVGDTAVVLQSSYSCSPSVSQLPTKAFGRAKFVCFDLQVSVPHVVADVDCCIVWVQIILSLEVYVEWAATHASSYIIQPQGQEETNNKSTKSSTELQSQTAERPNLAITIVLCRRDHTRSSEEQV